MKEMLLPRNSKKKDVDFEQFSAWAQKNLNVYALIAPFEIIPTPVRERNIIAGLLNNQGPPQEGKILVNPRPDLLHPLFTLVAQMVHLCHAA